MNDQVEQVRNKVNSEIRTLLSIIDFIDGKTKPYENYAPNSLNEQQFLEQQLRLIVEAKTRLTDIFK